MKTNIHFWSYLAEFFLELEMFQAKLVQKITKHILHSIFFSEGRDVYEIKWYNTAVPERPHMTIQNGVCVFRAGYLRLHIQAQNM